MTSPAVDLSSLTEDQQLALQQFTSVTDQELSAALPLLQQCQWNAQIAITRFFDGDAETIDPAAEAARIPAPVEQRRESLIDSIPSRSFPAARRGLEPAPRVVAQPEGQITQQIPFPFSILLLPFNLTYTILGRVLGTIGYLFPFLPRLLNRFYSGRASGPSRDTGRRPLNPRDTAARFIREFEEEYGVTHNTLPFYEGGYAQAFDAAKRDLKYLLVVLVSPEHDDTQTFLRDVLLAPEITDFIQRPENSILLWAGTVQDAESYQVASALRVTKFPYACLIVHTPSVSSTAMSKIATIAGPTSAQDMLAKLEAAMRQQSQELDRVRRQRQEQQATRNLREEQESAYERSLAADREKARLRREQQAEQEKTEREERERSERKANDARNLLQWRRWRAQNLPAEPSADLKDAVRISIRLPSGERVIRKFGPQAALEELYAFVECYDILHPSEEEEEVSEKPAQEPIAYTHEYQFRLVSPMPREVYDLDTAKTIRERVGRSGNLIVEKIIENDDEEDAAEEGNDEDL